VDGTPTDYDRKYLIDFDPGPDDDDEEEDPFVHLIVAEQPADARHFESELDAWNFYLEKPLSAFAVDLLEVESKPKTVEAAKPDPEPEHV
jgi:hypothetical protein